ncbi:MAG: hypothetical protein ABSG68_23680 [Thermoguttaceae bacterium]|jgi:hypothetical protein
MTAAPAPELGGTLPPAWSATPSPAMTGEQGVDAQGYYTLDQLKEEMKKLAWTKGDFKVVPYGILWITTVYESERTSPGAFTYYVLPERPDTKGAFYVDPRSTRLGVDVFGPPVEFFGAAQTGGRVEFDFQRQIDTENKPSVILRHAYLEIKNEDYRLLCGQTWDVISPLIPGVLSYAAGWNGGNIGYRRAQLRGERYWALSGVVLVTVQGSANADIITDVSPAGVPPNPPQFTCGDADWPVMEGRAAITLGRRENGCRPIELGVSGHVGDQIFDFNTQPFLGTGRHRRTWSFNTDMKIPITERLGVQSEFFTGENLGAFQGGILQGIDPVTHNTIRSMGGWFDVCYDWTPRWHSHAGYSIDHPFDQDVVQGRISNAFIFTNLIYDVTAKFLVGLEITSWETHWVGQPATVATHGESLNVEFHAKYSF